MRPVLLDMDGFAAFREETRVDFRGADYFVLVGPTGSGKSTVLDAISFALYGTVPRWEDRRKVALALAPTAARGTVRLVFDVGGARYQVARELRRSGGVTRAVSIKNARFERLADRNGLGEVGEPSELLAADSFVNDAIAKLLGLSFDHFCKCVSLPQGAFAEFLHAKPSDRDDILGDLLGLGVYEVIARRAREEAAGHRASVTALADQLTSFADATEEAERVAAAHVEILRTLSGTVDGAVPQLRKLTDAVTGEANRAGQLASDAQQLSAVAPPEGLAELAAQVETVRTRLETAQLDLTEADKADKAARDARREAPQRSPLEEVERDHRDLAAALAAEPALSDELTDALRAAEQAAEATGKAGEAEDAARTERDTVADRHRDAATLAERLSAELTALAAVTPPDGIGELATRAKAARTERDEAAKTLTTAETADDEARAAAKKTTGRRAALQRGAQTLEEITELETGRPDLETRRAAAAQAQRDSATELETAQGHLKHTQTGYDDATRTDLAAALRPQLTAGDDCPVCAQQVAVLPPPLPAGDLARAGELLKAAKVRLQQAERAVVAAERDAGRLDDEQQRLDTRISALRAELAGVPDSRTAIDAELAAVEALLTAETDAATARGAAKTRLRDADTELGKVIAAEQDAARLLAKARDPLIALALDAPPAGDDVAAGWQQLHAWAAEQSTTRRRDLTGAQAAADREAAALDAAKQAFTAAQTATGKARQAEIAANGSSERIKAQHDALTGQITRLTGALTGKPDHQQVLAELARIDELDELCRKADERVRAARTGVDLAQQQLAGVNKEVDAGWRQLRAARDPLVRFDAPEPSGDDLQAAWTQLQGWAAAQATSYTEQAAAAQLHLAELETSRDAAAAELSAALTAAGLTVRADLPLTDAAPLAVTKATTEAAAAVDRIAERRTQALVLEQRRAAAERDQQVAAHLGQLLRTDNFPRWLAASALNTLLMEASASLLELSAGQFELTHDGTGGDLLIVDHADADSRRPVKTLSGGETFQASLALALALSSQMAALAEAGAARLDSIFLDEGFGTLDETTLEVVADTLQTLVGQKDRMVGVITHVPALAERIPVKFNVARDQSSSRVTRSDA